jgi:hypothetical protein
MDKASVIQANLDPDRTYDCVVDAGVFAAGFVLNVMTGSVDPRHAEIAEWETEERVMVADRRSGEWGRFEEEQRAKNERIVNDVINGPERAQLQLLGPSHYR